MTSDDGKKYLTKRGQQGIKTIDRCDITNLLAAHHFNSKMMSLQKDEYFFAKDFSYNDKKSPACIYKYKGEPGHSLNKVGANGTFETVFLDINDESVKPLIRHDICLNDMSWFLYNKKLYFASRKYNKILPVSIYYTDAGINMLWGRRCLYCRIVNKECRDMRDIIFKTRTLRQIPLYFINIE